MNEATLRNGGMTARIIGHGARLMSLTVPDGNGSPVDVALGLPDADAYAADDVCMGAVMGRNTSRIAGARCVIGGTEYRLTANDGPNNSHSGPNGFEHASWQFDERAVSESSATLELVSPDMSQGFPGTLRMRATYRLIDGNTLELSLEGSSDRDTVCNPTSHIYWNLNGDAGSALDHTLRIPAARYFPTDENFLPLDAEPVEGTPFDFRTPRTPRKAMASAPADRQLAIGRGYNHAYDFAEAFAEARSADAPQLIDMATLTGERSGITMTLSCDAPALVVYSAGFFDHIAGRNGITYGPSAGLALEPGFLPNAINDTHNGTTPAPMLRAGERFHMTIRWRFAAVSRSR